MTDDDVFPSEKESTHAFYGKSKTCKIVYKYHVRVHTALRNISIPMRGETYSTFSYIYILSMDDRISYYVI